jgi:hypothetical protein
MYGVQYVWNSVAGIATQEAAAQVPNMQGWGLSCYKLFLLETGLLCSQEPEVLSGTRQQTNPSMCSPCKLIRHKICEHATAALGCEAQCRLVRALKVRCSCCHTPPLGTNTYIHKQNRLPHAYVLLSAT